MKTERININENCIDLIRVICTFTVFLGHFLAHFQIENVFFHGVAYFVRGVPVFFFISGLFIARSLEKYAVTEYLKRRALRILPELWVCVLLNLMIIFASGIRGGVKDTAVYLGTQMTAFQFYTGSWLREYGVGVPNGALWTITVDLQFYIIAIGLAKWLSKRNLKLWGILIFLSMILSLILNKCSAMFPEIVNKLLECSFISFMWIFLCGMCIYYHRDKLIPLMIRGRWIAAAVYLLWQYAVPKQAAEIFSGIRYNAVTTFLLLLCVTGFGFCCVKRFRKDYSYSFYLYHMVVINFVIHNIFPRMENTAQTVICFIAVTAATGILAVLSRHYIAGMLTEKLEKRFLKRECQTQRR